MPAAKLIRSLFGPFKLMLLGWLCFIALIVWLRLQPRSPTFTVTELSVPPGAASTASALSYNLEIENPNKNTDIHFDEIRLTFFNGHDRAAEDKISAFDLHGKTTVIISGRKVNVDGHVWKTLRNAILNATAELKVGIVTRMRYKTWRVMGRHHGVQLQGTGKIGKDGKLLEKEKKIKLK